MLPHGASRQNDSMQATRPTNVFIVDDSPSIRARLVEMLAALPSSASSSPCPIPSSST